VDVAAGAEVVGVDVDAVAPGDRPFERRVAAEELVAELQVVVDHR
jgi:hypothetical protein